MQKYLLTLILCAAATIAATAQSPNFPQAERFMKNRTGSLVGTMDIRPLFFDDGTDRFLYAIRSGGEWIYYLVDPVEKTQTELSAQSEVVQNLLSSRRNASNNHDPDPFTNVSPNGAYGMYLENFNLYLQNRTTNTVTQLTHDGEKHYTYAGSETMGIRFDADPFRQPARGAWLNDAKYFYILREDTRRLETLAVIDIFSRRPRIREERYVMTGDEFVPQFELWIFNTETQTGHRVNIDKWKDQTIKMIYPRNDEKPWNHIYFTRERRTRDEMELCRVDPATGEVTVLINEVSRPFFPDEFFSVTILNDGKDIIWWSDRTGWGHYYLYNDKGEMVNAITSGEWVAGKILKVDADNRMLYVEGYGQVKGEPPYFMRATKARFDSHGETTILTPEMATHNVTFSPNMTYIVDNYSRADLEPVSVLRDINGNGVMELFRPDLSRLYATGWKMPEPFTAKAADGVTDLFGYMWKPYDFDSTRQYPIITYVYPGPQTDHFPLTFSVSANYNAALAQVGFIVVNFGHRGGTPMREKAYHSYGYNNIRDYPLADNKFVLEQLGERHDFIDLSNVGILGHSGGGFMAAAAILTYPDFYKAAVAASGNHDNTIYNKAFAELYSGIEERTVDGKTVFEVNKIPTTMELVSNLKGHLMLVTGDADNNVHPAHTLRLARALIDAGKDFEFVILPGEAHNYSGNNNDFFERKVWGHFARYLLGK